MAAPDAPFVTPADLDEVELVVLRRLREYTLGDHRSQFHGPGFDYVGLRSWEPGDRLSTVDWAQSSLTNFSPLMVRDFEQPGTAAVVVVADRSASTRCGVDGVPIAESIAWAVGTLGLSAAFFQDSFGLITFDGAFANLARVAPRPGRQQAIHCVGAYQYGTGLEPMPRAADHIGQAIAAVMPRTALIPVISDGLFDNVDQILTELAHLNVRHDVFLALVDAAAAFALPAASAAWVHVQDVETGRPLVLSRRAVRRLADRARAFQDDVAKAAADRDLDVVRLSPDKVQSANALVAFATERRSRKQ